MVLGVLGLAACGGKTASVADGGADGGPDLGVVINGTRLLAGDLDVVGVTSDGLVAVVDQSRGVLAVPLAGGPFQTVDAMGESAGVYANVVASFRNFDEAVGFGDLALWTAASTARVALPASTGVLAYSSDGARFLATTLSSSDATMTNLVVGSLDGTENLMVLAASLDGACRPRAAFGGGTFVVSHCAPGSTSVTISAVDPVSGAVTSLLEDAQNDFAVVPGDKGLVAVIDAAGDAFLTPAAGGEMTIIGHDVEAVVAVSDGSGVLLRARGVISRVALASAQPTILVGSGAESIWTVSTDGQSLLFRLNFGPRDGYGDLFLTSAVAPGAPVTLSTAVDATTFGDAFTKDGSRVLYITEANDLFVGTLRSRSVGGSDAPTIHGRAVWTTRAYSDARVVFTSDFVPLPERRGRTVLRTADTAGTASSIIATFAGPDFFLTPERDRVVFSFNDGSDRAGLYVAPLPGAKRVVQDAAVADVADGSADEADAAQADASSGAEAGVADGGTDDAVDAGSTDAPSDLAIESIDGADLGDTSSAGNADADGQ